MAEENITLYNQDKLPRPMPELSVEPADKRPAIIGIIVALTIVLIFAGIGWWLFINPVATAILRDIFIIFMGLGMFLIILLLIVLVVATTYLVLKVNDLTQLLDREIRPILSKIQDTLQTAKGTTVFYSEHAVRPVITMAGYVAGVQAIFRSLFRRR
jgi:hypothetical protein